MGLGGSKDSRCGLLRRSVTEEEWCKEMAPWRERATVLREDWVSVIKHVCVLKGTIQEGRRLVMSQRAGPMEQSPCEGAHGGGGGLSKRGPPLEEEVEQT